MATTERSPKYKRYAAFISYRHQTYSEFVERFEQALKEYAKPILKPPIKIFRDEKHLVPGIDLPQLIRAALDDSEFLILLASPKAASSDWVSDELAYWCGSLGRSDNLIVLLLEGEVSTNRSKEVDWQHSNALPLILREYLTAVPYYIDMRSVVGDISMDLANPDFKKSINGVVARLRGIDPNEMLGTEVRQHRRNIFLRNAALVMLLTLTVVSLIGILVALRERGTAIGASALAEARRRDAVFAAAGAEMDQGHVAAAYDRVRVDPGLPSTFRSNVDLMLFETSTIVDSKAVDLSTGTPDSFDADELYLSSDGQLLLFQGYYTGVHIVDLTNRNHLADCGHDLSRFSRVYFPPSHSFVGLQSDSMIQIRTVPACREAGTFEFGNGKSTEAILTTAIASDGPSAVIAAIRNGALVKFTAQTSGLKQVYSLDNATSIDLVVASPNRDRLALGLSNGVLRLIDQTGMQVAPDLQLRAGAVVSTHSVAWITFIHSLNQESKIGVYRPRLGTEGKARVLAFLEAPRGQARVAMEHTEDVLSARITMGTRSGCTFLEWLTSDYLHREVIGTTCTDSLVSSRQELKLPTRASAGAFCGTDGPMVIGTDEGSLVWARATDGYSDDNVGVEHTEENWSDSVRNIVCTETGTAFAAFRATGIKRYQNRFNTVTRHLTAETKSSDSFNSDRRLDSDKVLLWNLDGHVRGGTSLRLLGEAGVLELLAPKQTVWSRRIAHTIPYRTGNPVDRVDGIAIDEARARVWTITSYGKLSVLDLYTGTPLMSIMTSYDAAGAAMNIDFSGIHLEPKTGNVEFTFGFPGKQHWSVETSVIFAPRMN